MTKLTKSFKELRNSRNISQSEIAEKLNVSRSTIAMWETGSSRPRLETIQNLAKIFKTTEQEIINCFMKKENK